MPFLLLSAGPGAEHTAAPGTGIAGGCPESRLGPPHRYPDQEVSCKTGYISHVSPPPSRLLQHCQGQVSVLGCRGCSLPPSACLSPTPLPCLSLISHHLTPAIPLCPAAPRAGAALWGTAALSLIKFLFPWILLTWSKLKVFFPCCNQKTWMR